MVDVRNLLDGIIDHRDMPLTGRKRVRNIVMRVCVSQPNTSTLLLDLQYCC